MSLKVLTLFFILSVSACRTSAQRGDKSVKPVGTVMLDSIGRHQLTAYFSIPQIEQIESYLNDFVHIKTAGDLHRTFKTIDKIYDGLADSLNAKQGITGDSILDLDPVNNLIPGINFSHYEGSSMLLNPELATFKRIAATTPEKFDDEFIAILIATYDTNKYYSFPAWIIQTTDFGGKSLLGNGIELNILSQIQTALAKSNEFENELNSIREIVFYDLFRTNCYDNDIPKIINELNKIAATIKLSDEEKIKLNKRITEFSSAQKELQTGCAKKECNCGG